MSLLPWILVGVVVFCFFVLPVLNVFVAMRERRPVRPFIPLDELPLDAKARAGRDSVAADANPYAATPSDVAADPLPPLSMQSQRRGETLSSKGYAFLGTFQYPKAGLYRLRFDLLKSPDDRILAVVNTGTVMKITIDDVALLTFVNDSAAREIDGQRLRIVESFTNENQYEPATFGDNDPGVYPGADVDELESIHRRRIAGRKVVPWNHDAVDQLWRWRRESFHDAVQRGKASYVDAGEQFVRPSIGAAVVQVLSTNRFMWGRRIYPHRWRLSKKSPT